MAALSASWTVLEAHCTAETTRSPRRCRVNNRRAGRTESRTIRLGGLMFILGVILFLLGFFLHITILTIIGVILLVIGAVLFLLGAVGRPVAGRRHYW
ncbi:DUF6131 family protein [Dactylosporangium sp. NPDC000555]|uniref:DUF6131 family protein n=2 Tax=unclassified Dactylosporangium TaxID=2621675 RepID=UPI00332A3326